MSGILDDLRYSGKINWDAIEDRGRVPYIPFSADGPKEAIEILIDQYRIDRQDDQDTQVEVWTEKDAISGILKRVTSEYHIRLVVNKGYSSSSAMHAAYLRFADIINSGRKVKILYFGDHDPSGLDMIRDIRERILFFMAAGSNINFNHLYDENNDTVDDWWNEEDYSYHDMHTKGFLPDAAYNDFVRQSASGNDPHEDSDTAFDHGKKMMFLSELGFFEVKPIGLTREQIEEFNPPPNPAKISDPRAKWYIEEHGEVSYEVDALNPEVMTGIVRDHIEESIDLEKFEAKKWIEEGHIGKMKEFAESFDNEENSEEDEED